MNMEHPVHEMKTKARVLLTSVFGPYARDDEYGSRSDNPMELYHNQVTRVQGPFSLRMFHRSFGLMLIQENIDAPTTLLDFPSLDRFISELKSKIYDIIGISGIIPNFEKVKEMCRLIRIHQPKATIVVGGHVANTENIEKRIDADHVVKGEGVRWFRRFLGQDENLPMKHPAVLSGLSSRVMGLPIPEDAESTAAILIPSVGCPMGCNFCSTSHLFGGKGKSINFYETGDELFEVMCGIEKKLGVHSFFALDENFLFHKKRALRLLELMKEHSKSWAIYIFSSARVISHYSMEQLLALGISWVWMGLEGENSSYEKLHGIDTVKLVKDLQANGIKVLGSSIIGLENLQANGIKVLGSSIIGLENHSPENIYEAIDFAVKHNTVFHQFMLYTPTSGTPLFNELKEKGVLLSEEECSLADAHGQKKFNYRHAHIRDGQEGKYLLDAFKKDFEVNGPSISRLFRTILNGYSLHKNHPDERVRKRIRWEGRELSINFASAISAVRRRYKNDPKVFPELDSLMKDIYREFGWKTRLLAPLLGLYVSYAIKNEEKRLSMGWIYEPPTFYEKNAAAIALGNRKVVAEKDFSEEFAGIGKAVQNFRT